MRRGHRSVLFAVVVAAVAADAGRADAKCSVLECGTNSPTMETYRFHELNLAGLYNAEGLRVTGLVQGGVTYQPRIVGDELRGIGPGGLVLAGTALAGAHLAIETDTDPVQHYSIFIEHVTDGIDYWVDPGEDGVFTYHLTYTGPVTTQRTALCPDPPDKKTAGLETETYVNPLEAILHGGDRYDADAKTVIATGSATRGWMNVACAGNALYKLHMIRHTEFSSDAAHVTTAGQRQAMLKMYVSDVCGNGDSFTLQGTPLHWDNLFGWGYTDGTEHSVEALWSEDGALCMDLHRLGDTYADDIAACAPRLPTCGDAYPGWETSWPASAYVASFVPYAP